jgi:hypothetical protein
MTFWLWCCLENNVIQSIISYITIENVNSEFDNLINQLHQKEFDDISILEINPNNKISLIPNLEEKKFKPTDEQLAIIKTSMEMKQGQILIVEALAGCTKTSTLEMITKENHNKSFLYLAFNKKIVEEAKSRFPSNTEVKTLHALAFKHKEPNKSIATNRTINDIISKLFDLDIATNFYKINNISKVYDSFCGSENTLNELDILEQRLIHEINDEYRHKPENERNRANFFIKNIKESIPYIPKLWEHIESSDITTHSTYLKTFVENNYTLNYDFIILDESQDVSRVLGKFIINSVLSYNYKVIIVGDNNQKIYGFLGNINLSKSLKNIVDNSIYIEKNLTKTFRFSKDSSIENMTNLILDLRDINIIGAKQQIKESEIQDEQYSIGYLSRGKLPVLVKALDFLQNKINFNLFMNKKQDFDIDLLIDIYELYIYTMVVKKTLIKKNMDIFRLSKCEIKFYSTNDKDIKEDIEYILNKFRNNRENNIFPKFRNKKFKKISSLYELEYGAYKNKDTDTMDSLKIVFFILKNFDYFNELKTRNSYTHIIEKSLSILIEEFSDEKSLNIISTIHKVKGLEYQKVVLIESSSISRTISLSESDNITLAFPSEPTVLGLCSSKKSNCKQVEKKKNLSYSINFGKVFDTKNNELDRFNLEDIEKTDKKVQIADELFIDNNINTQEEYNILYVGITRAERIIEIQNSKYHVTLKFLEFLQKNKIEIEKIINNKESHLLISRDVKKDDIGIVYEKSFISIQILKEFMFQFKGYNL